MSDIRFQGDWTSQFNANVVEWAREKFIELTEESPENDFLEFIALVVSNKKSVSEITAELNELIGEELAR